MGISEQPWSAFEAQAQERLEAARERYGNHGFRMEASEDPDDEGGDDGSAGEILQRQEVQDAIRQATIRGREQALQEAKEREQGLVRNKEEILGEKKQLQGWIEELGGREEIETALGQYKKLKAMKIADETGVDPDKVHDTIEREAQERFSAFKKAEQQVWKKKDEKIEELTKAVEDAQSEARRRFAAETLVRASVPDEWKLVHDNAWDVVLDAASKILVPVKDEASGMDVVRIRDGEDRFAPGSGPGDYMTPQELLDQARQGKGPLGKLSFCFVSNGKGSGTRSVTTSATTKPWSKMSLSEQAAWSEGKTAAEIKDFMRQSHAAS